MPDDGAEFDAFVRRFQGGDPAAFAALYDRYGPVIRRAVRGALGDRLRTHFDSLDFAQDVWASVYAARTTGRVFPDAGALVGYLVAVARNKVRMAARRRFGTQMRDPAREIPVGPGAGVCDPGPTPSRVAAAAETWDRLLAAAPARFRPLVVLLRDGHTHEDVAARAGVCVRTVQRLVRQLQTAAGLDPRS